MPPQHMMPHHARINMMSNAPADDLLKPDPNKMNPNIMQQQQAMIMTNANNQSPSSSSASSSQNNSASSNAGEYANCHLLSFGSFHF